MIQAMPKTSFNHCVIASRGIGVLREAFFCLSMLMVFIQSQGRGYFSENDVEHDIGYQQSQTKLKGLPENIECNGFAAFKIMLKLPEIGFKADGGKCQCKEPFAADTCKSP